MATGTAVITRAYRMIGVKSQGQALSADEVADALEALNQMLTRWEADGLAMGFATISAASETLKVPDENVEAVCANLAVIMAPEFGVTPSPNVFKMAVDGLAALERDVIKPRPVRLDAPSGESVGTVYNIRTDG
jgi:hypothetical protein